MTAIGCVSETSEDFVCDIRDRDGTYLMQAEEMSGDCGPIPDRVVIVDSDSPSGAISNSTDDCTVEYERIGDDACSISRKLVCVSRVAGVNVYSTGTGVTEQVTAYGSVIEGTLTVTSEFSDGSYVLFAKLTG